MSKTSMTDSERKELEQSITYFLEQAVSDEYARTILESEYNDDGDTLLDNIVENVLETSAWEEEHRYNDSDIRYAIGRELINLIERTSDYA